MQHNFNLRGVSGDMMSRLKCVAQQEKTSVNSIVLKLIAKSFGVAQGRGRTVYHDLDALAGTWSEKDATGFKEATKALRKIDKDIWT
jgi:hypothetical protein